MLKLRVLVILLVFWVVVLFNIERWDIVSVNIPTLLYIVAGVVLIPPLLLSATGLFRLKVIVTPIVIAYISMRYFGIFTTANTNIPELLTEAVLLFITLWLAREVSVNLGSFEDVMDYIGVNTEDDRILSGVQGEETVNHELFRARRYDRPVALLYVQLPSMQLLRELLPHTFQYQVAMEHRYYQMRIARIIETMTYKTDTIVWYGENLVVCLPETNMEEAMKLADQINEIIEASVMVHVPMATASFPQDGLIYSDLVAAAEKRIDSEKVTGFTSADNKNADQHANTPDTAPAPTAFAPGLLRAFSNTGLYKRLSNSMSVLVHDVDLLPEHPQLQLNDNQEKQLYYDPDYWINHIPHQSEASRKAYGYLKRLIDLSAVLIVSPLLLLVAGGVAIAIKLDDGGSIFYSQYRTGLGGRQFKMYKFRSMVENADKRLAELGVTVNERNETVDAQGNKLKHDARVTRVGRFIRKTSLDELPQLWNVFTGDMSLVGPRPTSFGVDKYQMFHTERLSVKPGITGLWQIHDRGDTDFDNRLIWDIKYIDKFSFAMDANILFRTVNAVLKNKGAS